MKIKEIKIENFGKLSGFNRTFADGINVINEENGWGKSTLAAFIKVMFFGFDDENKKIVNREREKYRPWQSGTYGGSIIFEANGKEYRMNRIFGSKAGDDRFALYDNATNLASTDYSDRIGEELFNLDSESFQRTVLIKQNDVKTQATDGISARLGNLAGATDDIDKYDKVIEKISKNINELSSPKKKSAGMISKIQDQISELSAETAKIPNVENSFFDKSRALEDLRKKLEVINNAADAYNKEIKASSKFAELVSEKKRYDGIIERCSAREKEKQQAEAAFPGSIPEEADLDNKISDAKRIREINIKAAGYKLTADEEAFLTRSADCFSAGIDFDGLNECGEQIELIEQKEKQYNALQFSEEEKADYEKFAKKFADKGDIEQDASRLIKDLTRSNSIRSSIPGNEVLLQSYITESSGNASALWLILLIVGIAAAAAGAVLAFKVSKIAGIVTAAAGAALAVIGIIIKASARGSKKGQDAALLYDNLRTKLESDRSFVETAEASAGLFLDRFGIAFDPDSALEDLSDLKNEYRRYKDLTAKKDDRRDDDLLSAIRSGRQYLDLFFAPFDGLFTSETGYAEKLNKLRYDAERYRVIEQKAKKYSECVEEMSAMEKPVLEYIDSLGFACGGADPEEKLAEIKDKLNVFRKACRELDSAVSEKQDFENSGSADEIRAADPASEIRSVDELHALISANNAARDDTVEKIGAYNDIVSELLENLDDLHEKENQLAEANLKYKALTKRAELLIGTRAFLEKARTIFTGKFSAPVANAFRRYFELADGTKGSEYSFNANMDLLIEDHGEYKDIDSYSSGSRDKIGLCFRLGLIEAMYPGEKPVIIMDDPFTNLDQKRIGGGKKILDVLKNDYQIIYLTCHESRMPS